MAKFRLLLHQEGAFYFIKNNGDFLHITDNIYLLGMEIKMFMLFEFLAILLTISHF